MIPIGVYQMPKHNACQAVGSVISSLHTVAFLTGSRTILIIIFILPCDYALDIIVLSVGGL